MMVLVAGAGRVFAGKVVVGTPVVSSVSGHQEINRMDQQRGQRCACPVLHPRAGYLGMMPAVQLGTHCLGGMAR